jgi:hypothetical protein
MGWGIRVFLVPLESLHIVHSRVCAHFADITAHNACLLRRRVTAVGAVGGLADLSACLEICNILMALSFAVNATFKLHRVAGNHFFL